MFESYEDILTIQDVADILKVGTTQVYKIVVNVKSSAPHNSCAAVHWRRLL